MNGDVYCLPFDLQISAFSCGLFTMQNRTIPVMVMATFQGVVYVYYNIANYESKFDDFFYKFGILLIIAIFHRMPAQKIFLL